jgi:ubiquinol-cytochrome c reductase cytochrome b subunit
MSIGNWLENRTGIGAGIRNFLFEEIPASAGWPQVFGSIALFVILVQAATGILLALNFSASPGDAYDSVSYIVRDVAGGRVIRGLHHWGASAMVIVVALHAAQVFLYGAYKRPREITWVSGVLLLLFVLTFGLTGYLLPWDNRAYWGTVVTTQIAGQAPWIGRVVQRALGAENGIGVVTFTRFYALHVLILPAITLLLIGLHVSLVRRHGVTPASSEPESKRHFYPGQVLKDTIAIFLVFAALITAAVFLDVPLERMADPTDSSYVPRPDWYFLFLFQALKLFQGGLEPLASVGLPTFAVLLLFAIPFLDRSPIRLWKKRYWAMLACGVVSLGWGVLTMAALAGTPRSAIAKTSQPEHQRILSMAPAELAGFDYFRHANCRSCHNLLEGEPKVGPTLATLRNRRPPEWIEAHVRSSSASAGSAKQQFSPQELNALIRFTSTIDPGKASDLETAPASVLGGADVFVRNLCESCHKVNGIGGQAGPPLNGLVSRRSRAWIEQHFLQPKVMSPGTIMPPYHFAMDERQKIIDYLLQLP